MKLEFIENIERDIENWQRSVLTTSYGISWKKFLPEAFLIARISDKKYVRNYLIEKFYSPNKISDFKKWLENNTNSLQIQKDLEILMGERFPFKNIKVFITTFHRAPYNFKQGFFYLIYRDFNKKRVITNIYHELMHFLFHKYYWDTCEKSGLKNEQIHIFKESLTVLLNPILKKRKMPLDTGYPIHQKLRSQIEAIWKKQKDFKKVFNKAIKIVKK